MQVIKKKLAIELFQYSYVLFDNRCELNSDLKAIVEMTWPNTCPEMWAKLLNCHATSCSVERRFTMLRKRLAKMAICHQIMFGNI